jgi:hypothetical protein
MWCPWADWLHTNFFVLEDLVEGLRKRAVVVAQHNREREPLRMDMVNKRVCLLLPPPVGCKSRRRNKDAARGYVDEYQGKSLSWALQRPHALAEEIALPQRFGVNLQEVTPGASAQQPPLAEQFSTCALAHMVTKRVLHGEVIVQLLGS